MTTKVPWYLQRSGNLGRIRSAKAKKAIAIKGRQEIDDSDTDYMSDVEEDLKQNGCALINTCGPGAVCSSLGE